MNKERGNILVFASSFPNPDNPVSGIFVEELAREQAKRFRVVVLAPAVGNVPRVEERDGMKIIRFRQGPFGWNLAGLPGGILPALGRNHWLWFLVPFYFLSAFLALARTVRTEKIELIHAHWLLPQGLLAAGYRVFLNRRVKLLVTCHGADLLKVSGTFSRWLKRFSLRHADAVTAVSELLRHKAEELGCKNCVILPMGVDSRLFSPDAARKGFRNQLGLKRKVILFVGSLIERKGVRALVDAVPEVVCAEPDVSFLLVGEGELEQELKLTVQKAGVEANVVFAGPRLHSDLPMFFAGSDIFILPSFSEGWPLVVMEALSSELRVVVSKLPVFMDHPDRDELFLTVTAGDSADIARTLIQALRQEDTDTIRQNGRSYAVRQLDLAVIGRRYGALIGELLQ